jgi:predicted DNA-binding protein (MmcQ/YjbR family)
MAADTKLTRERMLAHALALPGAHEDHPWGETVVKVNGKIFLFAGCDEEGVLSFSLKLPESGTEALGMAFTTPTAYGLGTKGWVSGRVTKQKHPPLELLLGWIDESWRAVAPKRLVKSTLAGEAPAPTAKPRAKAKAKAKPKTQPKTKPKR